MSYVAPSIDSPKASGTTEGPRLDRFHKQQKRADRLNYVAIVFFVLIAFYVAMTIIRPLFANTRPGKISQDFGCISKSTISDCSVGSHHQ